MPEKGYVLTVDDEAKTPLVELVPRLEAAGLVVDRVLDEIRVIVGRAEESALERIRAVPGVSAMDEDGTVTL